MNLEKPSGITNNSAMLSLKPKTLADMRKNLGAASGESEVFKRQTMELKLRIEALGLDASGSNSSKLEQRLLSAVRDLRVMAEENKKLSEAIVQLSEAAALYAKTSTNANAEASVALEAAKRNANAALGGTSPNAVEAQPGSLVTRRVDTLD